MAWRLSQGWASQWHDRIRHDLSNLKPPKGAKHAKKRIGRGQGSGNGKTAGRGHKGAKSRSGFKFKRGFEGGQMPLHRRVPKRGFHNPFRVEYEVVNLDTLAERFEAGTVVTPELLRERGIVSARQAAGEGAGARRHRQGADRARRTSSAARRPRRLPRPAARRRPCRWGDGVSGRDDGRTPLPDRPSPQSARWKLWIA